MPCASASDRWMGRLIKIRKYVSPLLSSHNQICYKLQIKLNKNPGRIMNAVRVKKKSFFIIIIFILNKSNDLASSELLMILCRVCCFFRRDINHASWTVGLTGYSTCSKIGTWLFQNTVKKLEHGHFKVRLQKCYLDLPLQLNLVGFYSKLQQSTDNYNPNV